MIVENFYHELSKLPDVTISEKSIILNELSHMDSLFDSKPVNDDGTIKLYPDDWKRVLRILYSLASRMD